MMAGIAAQLRMGRQQHLRLAAAALTAPRLLNRAQAAAYCGLRPSGFDGWVKRGLLPRPLDGTRRWDRLSLDKMLDERADIRAAATPLDGWLADYAG
jgi:predicted DNA-binding transcriptional regulator AlpA